MLSISTKYIISVILLIYSFFYFVLFLFTVCSFCATIHGEINDCIIIIDIQYVDYPLDYRG